MFDTNVFLCKDVLTVQGENRFGWFGFNKPVVFNCQGKILLNVPSNFLYWLTGRFCNCLRA